MAESPQSFKKIRYYLGGAKSEMNECGHRGEQERCPKYEPKCSIPGKVNMTCIWFRKDYLGCELNNGGSICTKSIDKGTVGVYK